MKNKCVDSQECTIHLRSFENVMVHISFVYHNGHSLLEDYDLEVFGRVQYQGI